MPLLADVESALLQWCITSLPCCSLLVNGLLPSCASFSKSTRSCRRVHCIKASVSAPI